MEGKRVGQTVTAQRASALVNDTNLSKRQIRRFAQLADVAEMYFIQKLTQKQIAVSIGTTPSNVSRMISDAERFGVVQIAIRRPESLDTDLAAQLRRKLGLAEARVVIADARDPGHVSRQIAATGARLLKSLMKPSATIGVTWGRTLLAMIENFGEPVQNDGRIIQLAGSVGAVDEEFDSVSLTQRLATLTSSRPIHLNSPFIVDGAEIAASLLKNASNAKARESVSECDIVIVGIGSLTSEHSSLFASGFVSDDEIRRILSAGAVAEVCGHPITEVGKLAAPEFSKRVVSVQLDDLRRVPNRISIAARPDLADAIVAAKKADLISHLVCDVKTAQHLIKVC